jgi:cytochrome bd-type quinol oxidase subunit 1
VRDEAPLGTIYVRRVFFILSVFVMIATLSGIIALTVMEYQARAALPPHEQTAEAIASIYDGAVCLACDYGRIFIVMLGPLAFVAVLIGWGIYEVGRRILIYWATPK